MEWKKTKKEVTKEGTTITYELEGTKLSIESRKRHIPHASGSGTWDHTSYWVMLDGVPMKERYTLRDAKQFAEIAAGMEAKS